MGLFLKKKIRLCPLFYFSLLNSAICVPKTSSQVVLLYDCDHDLVLFEKKADTLIHPASTTKIATLLYALSKGWDPSERVNVFPEILRSLPKAEKIRNNYTIEPYLLEPDAYTIGLSPGSFYTLHDLYHALMLVSANDAANVIAYHLGGRSIENFMLGLNDYLKSIGCKNTTYVNPSGLEYPSHRTTAHDLAKMLLQGLKNTQFMDIVQKVRYIMQTCDVPDNDLNTSNRLLRQDKGMLYKYCLAGKTGYTEHAGYCFVSAAQNNERRLISVVMQSPNATDRFIDATNLFNAGFNEKKISRTFYNKEDPCFQTSAQYSSNPVYGELKEDLSLYNFESVVASAQPLVELKQILLPIKRGDPIGKVSLVGLNGKILEEKIIFSTCHKGHTVKSYLLTYKWGISLTLLAIGVTFLIFIKLRAIFLLCTQKARNSQEPEGK
jgi:D-alanyl-D-alanine carboxypeptidase (penicillin-binding protein 5/6)